MRGKSIPRHALEQLERGGDAGVQLEDVERLVPHLDDAQLERLADLLGRERVDVDAVAAIAEQARRRQRRTVLDLLKARVRRELFGRRGQAKPELEREGESWFLQLGELIRFRFDFDPTPGSDPDEGPTLDDRTSVLDAVGIAAPGEGITPSASRPADTGADATRRQAAGLDGPLGWWRRYETSDRGWRSQLGRRRSIAGGLSDREF